MTQPDASTPDAPVAGRAALTVGLLAGVVCVAFETVAVATAMPQAAKELGNLGLYAWAFTLFVLGMVFSTALAGRLADRVGPVRPLAIGTALFLAGLLVAGAAPSMLILVLARFLQGVGGGAMNLCLMVVVAHAFDERQRAGIMTWFSVCWVMPAFLGPPISAAITHRWGWHWVFWALVAPLVAATALAARPLARLHAEHRAPDPGQAKPVPLWAAGLAALSVAALQGAGQILGWRGALLGAMALLGLGVSVPPLMPPRFLRVGQGLSAVVWSRAAQAGAFFATEAFLPLSLVELRGMTLFRAGLALTIGSLGWTVGSWVQSRPWLRLRRDQIILLGVGCSAVGIAAMALSAWHPQGTLPLAAVGWTVGGFGMGLAIASGSLAVMTLSEPAQLGRNTSSLQTAEGLGNALIGALAGTIFHALHASSSEQRTFGLVFAATAACGLFGILTAGRIGPVRNASAAD
ncbi:MULTISPECIES: MFS transporter [unclassified Luteococcus]|uniref:MFS transporter n=1 Tax=unclassified Luteococcus TaxID=2639923 RepID=UPI00313BF56B